MTEYPKAQINQLLRNQFLDPSDLLYLAETGSMAHGTNIGDQSDFDATGIRIESFEELVLAPDHRQSLFLRTQPDGQVSRLGDIDLNVYTLRKFARLAQKGNPSILATIFSPLVHRDSIGPALEVLAGKVASKQAGYPFLGYMRQQIERWVGERGNKGVRRQELVEKFGYDTKYAAHVIRLGIQGTEYLLTGRFTMPMPTEDADLVRAVRTGEWSEQAALALADQAEARLKAAMENSPLPEHPAPIDIWLVDLYDRLLDM